MFFGDSGSSVIGNGDTRLLIQVKGSTGTCAICNCRCSPLRCELKGPQGFGWKLWHEFSPIRRRGDVGFLGFLGFLGVPFRTDATFVSTDTAGFPATGILARYVRPHQSIARVLTFRIGISRETGAATRDADDAGAVRIPRGRLDPSPVVGMNSIRNWM